MKIGLQKEREVLDINANICASFTNFLQIAWVNDFKQSTSPYLQKKILMHMILLERIFGNEKIDNCNVR